MTPEVICNAVNCTYHVTGNLCTAGLVQIKPNVEDGPARTTGDTACSTFRFNRGVADYLAGLGNYNVSGVVQAPFQGGQQISPDVSCSVENCLHHAEDGTCRAEFINVSGPDATSEAETDCATFLPRS